MSNDGGDGAARGKDGCISTRLCRRHSTLKGTDDATVVISPTLDASDIALRAYPIVKDRFDNLLEGLRIAVHRGHQVSKARVALNQERHHHLNLLVGLNLVKPRINDELRRVL